MKANPWPIIKAQQRVYFSQKDGRLMLGDHLWFEGLPIAIGVACGIVNVTLPSGAYTALLTVTGVLVAFFFGTLLQIAARTMAWVHEGPPRGKDTADQADYLEELAASSAYAAVLSIVSAAVFVACVVFLTHLPTTSPSGTAGHPTHAATQGVRLRVLTALGLALLTHLALVLLMVLRRIFALVQGRLVKVRTGRGGSGGDSADNVREMAARRTAG